MTNQAALAPNLTDKPARRSIQTREGKAQLRGELEQEHSQLEPNADFADEGAVGCPELGLPGRADAVPPRGGPALDLLPAKVPRPEPLAGHVVRRAHRDRRRRFGRLENREREMENFEISEWEEGDAPQG